MLLTGFGLLLVLLILSGLNALHVLTELQTRSQTILRDFLVQQQDLDKIRSAIYLAGTNVRDFVLDPGREPAAQNRAALEDARVQVTAMLANPRTLSAQARNQALYQSLKREIDEYWRTIDPVLSWNANVRARQGYRFLHDEVLPRRSSTLGIANTIASVNQQQLMERDDRLIALFSSFRNQLKFALLIMVIFGVLEASGSTIHLLRMERRTMSHLTEVGQARQDLRNLSMKLVTAQETERKNLSRELHDALGQSLSAVQFELHDLAVVLGPDQPQHIGRVDRIRELVESCLAMVRNMARLLRPAMLDDLGLATALEWQAREISRSSGIRMDFRMSGLSNELPDGHRTCIFRIVQESLNNVCRHANAGSVQIQLKAGENAVSVTIQDDGCGFRAAQTRGLGLIGMQERAESLGGDLKIASEPGKGTRIDVLLPLPKCLTRVKPDQTATHGSNLDEATPEGRIL